MSDEQINEELNEIKGVAKSTIKIAEHVGARYSPSSAGKKVIQRGTGKSDVPNSSNSYQQKSTTLSKPSGSAIADRATKQGTAISSKAASTITKTASKSVVKAKAALVASGPHGWVAAALSNPKPILKIFSGCIFAIIIIACVIISLPALLFNSIFGRGKDPEPIPYEIYINEIVNDVTLSLEYAYEKSLQKVLDEVNANGYDMALTLQTVPDKSLALNQITIPYIISCYDTAVEYHYASREGLNLYILEIADQLFEFSWTVCSQIEYVPTPVYGYKWESVSVIDSVIETSDGISYTYKTVYNYVPDGSVYYLTEDNPSCYVGEYTTSTNQVLVNGVLQEIQVNEFTGNLVEKTVDTIEIKYLDVDLKTLTRDDILTIMDIDPNAPYEIKDADYTDPNATPTPTPSVSPTPSPTPIPSSTDTKPPTYMEMILVKEETLYKLLEDILDLVPRSTEIVPISKSSVAEVIQQLKNGSVSGNRQQIVNVALSLVNSISYHIDGKPTNPGWNDSWWSTDIVDLLGRPDGLDGSGFIEWVYWTAGLRDQTKDFKGMYSIAANTEALMFRDLLPGDIVFQTYPDTEVVESNMVGIFLGTDSKGVSYWISCNPVTNTVSILNSPFSFYCKLRDSEALNGDNLLSPVASSYEDKNPKRK